MHTRTVLAFCTASALAGALFAGSAFGKAEEKNMSDSWITAKIKIALFANPDVKSSDISVGTTDGFVVIRGKVDSHAAKQTAEAIAKGIDGTKSVKNDLQIVPPSRREVIDDRDGSITARVNERMAKDTQLKTAGIRTQTNAGVVSLTGEVADLLTRAHASWSARQVPGVKSVKNDLTVRNRAERTDVTFNPEPNDDRNAVRGRP